jgi:hypothetical protein
MSVFNLSWEELVRCRQDLGSNRLHVGIRRPMIHYACAQAELRPQHRIGKIHAATLYDALQDGPVHPVQVGFRQPTAAEITETHSAQLDGCRQFEFRLFYDDLRQVPGMIKVVLDRPPKCVQPVLSQ